MLSSYNNIAALLSIALGFYVLAKNRKKRLNQVYSLLSFAIFIWSFGFSKEITSLIKTEAFFWNKTLYSGAIFIPVLFLHLIFLFINKAQLYKKQLLWYYGYSFVLLSLNFTPYFTRDLIKKGMYSFITVPGIAYYFFLASYFLGILYGIYVLYKQIKKLTDNSEKNRLKLILFASIVGFLGGASTFLLIYFNINPIGSYFFFLYSLILAYAITKQKLFDISVVIKKIPAYILTAIFIAPIFLLSIYFTHENLKLLLTVNALLGVTVAFIGKPLQEFIITTAKHTFTKGFYDPEALIKQITDKIQNLKNRKEIFEIIASELDKAIQFEDISVLLAGRNENNTDFLEKYTWIKRSIDDPSKYDSTDISLDSNFIAYIKNSYTPISFGSLENKIQDEIKNLLSCSEKFTFLPFKSPEFLEGVVLLGERSNGVALKQKDIDFFSTLISIINVFLFKLTPYEKIQKEFKENEKKLFDAEKKVFISERISSMMHLIQEYNHEIRTPLQVIFTDLEQINSYDNYLEYKDEMMTAAEKINDIVGTTLRLSGEDQWIRKEEKIELVSFLRQIIKDYSFPNNIKVINSLFMEPAMEPIYILGDKRDLPFVFNNIFKNACEAMVNGGNVKISLETDAEFVHIKIADTGVGIAKEKLSTIWNPFVSSQVTKGRGLGLSIVYRIVGEHNGHVDAESKEGQGAVFIVSLPLK